MKLFMRMMSLVLPTCEEVSVLASRAMDEALPWHKRIGLRLHLMVCLWCRRSAGQLETIRDLARCTAYLPDDRHRLSPDARERIVASLSRDDHPEPDA